MTRSVTVVGGGVVGVCCALHLQKEGFSVTVVERAEPGENASAASCGSIAVSEVLPLSSSGVMLRVPGWMLDPSGPLTIRPRTLVSSLPWFLRFARNAQRERTARISRDIAALTVHARQDLQALLRSVGLSDLLRNSPVIELYDKSDHLEAVRYHHDTRRALGFDLQEVSGAEAADIEPSIARDFGKAVVMSDWCSIVDGEHFIAALMAAFVSNGGTVERAEVRSITSDGVVASGVSLMGGRVINSSFVVLAAGAWTPQLARSEGSRLMIEAASGYSTMIVDPDISMNHAVTYPRGGFGVTPYRSGLAIAGGVEFAGLAGKPNWKRANALVQKARRVIPKIARRDGTQRIGRRPLTPDSLPVIDKAPGFENVFIAAGHGQLGITLGATTGRLIAALASGKQPHIDLSPYQATRFAR